MLLNTQNVLFLLIYVFTTIQYSNLDCMWYLQGHSILGQGILFSPLTLRFSPLLIDLSGVTVFSVDKNNQGLIEIQNVQNKIQ